MVGGAVRGAEAVNLVGVLVQIKMAMPGVRGVQRGGELRWCVKNGGPPKTQTTSRPRIDRTYYCCTITIQIQCNPCR